MNNLFRNSQNPFGSLSSPFEFQQYDFQHQGQVDFTTIDLQLTLARITLAFSSEMLLFLLARTFPGFAPFCWVIGALSIAALFVTAYIRREAQFWVLAIIAFASVILAHWDMAL